MALAALFVAYWHWSAASTPPQPVASQPASRPVRDVESGGGLGVWVPMYDKSGRLRQQFRAQRFDPRGGGLYHVIRPEAEFYFTQGSTPPAGTRPSQPSSPQVVRLVGVEGDVNTVAGRTDPTLGSPMPSSLSRGVLQDVTISIYPDTTAASRDQADMTFTMDNLAFDNDTFRIYTPGGPNTAPDRVPVRGYGNDADFDGEGLEMRWDEMAHRLLSLEIAHGHRLTVKNAAALGMDNAAGESGSKWSGGAGANTGAAASAPNGAPAAPGPVTTGGSNGLTTGGSTTLTAGGSTTAPSQAQLYRANFHENVRVVQGGVEKITADVMHVDFVSGSSVPPTTKPAPGPGASTQIAVAAAQSTAGGGAISGDVAGAGGGALAHDAGGSTGLTTGSSTGVTPGTGPVDVYWTGILRIVPLDAESSGPAPTAGKAIVRLDGNPVHVHDGTAQVTGAHVTYWGSDQSALAEGSTAVPAELTDSSPDGSLVLDAAWMRFDGAGQAATLGPGRGKFRGKPSAPGAAEPVVDVNWTRQVTVNLTPGADGSLTLRRARLEGNVDVHSSTGVHVSGDSMDMTFDPSLATPRGVAGPNGGGLTGSTLTRAVVEKGAMCELTDANGIKRTIAGDEVSMEMGRQDGNAYPKHVNADGSVVVTTPDGRLEGAHLESTLLPAAGGSTPLATGGAAASASPAGAVRLQEMEMTRDVKLTGQNGVVARGTELNVRTTDAGENIVLWGEPAWATDGASTLTGPSIVLLPAAQQASVSGAGTLVTTRNAGAGLMPGSTALTTGGSAGLATGGSTRPATRGSTAATTRQAATQPVTITWKNGATLDGQQNELDVTGTVNLHTIGDDGADQDASAAKMVLTLADKPPTTAPAKDPAANKGASTRSASGSTALTATDPLDVGNMGFMSNKQVTAAKLIGGAKVASVLNGPDGKPVRTQSLTADEIDLNAIRQIMTVPGPGELIATETGPTTRPATAAAAGAGGSSGNGSTGISWNKRLVYDTAKGVATFDGPAHVVHLDGSTPAVRTDMYADQLVATFGTGATAAGGAQQLKSLTAGGQVRMQTRGQVIDGGTLLYDPIAQYVIIKGTDQWPGSIHDAQGLKNNAFNVLEMDLQTGQIKILEGMSGQIQR